MSKVNPIDHAIRLSEGRGIREAIKLASGMVHISRPILEFSTDPRTVAEAKKNQIFWMNVVAYLNKRAGAPVKFSSAVLSTYHTQYGVRLGTKGKGK